MIPYPFMLTQSRHHVDSVFLAVDHRVLSDCRIMYITKRGIIQRKVPGSDTPSRRGSLHQRQG